MTTVNATIGTDKKKVRQAPSCSITQIPPDVLTHMVRRFVPDARALACTSQSMHACCASSVLAPKLSVRFERLATLLWYGHREVFKASCEALGHAMKVYASHERNLYPEDKERLLLQLGKATACVKEKGSLRPLASSVLKFVAAGMQEDKVDPHVVRTLAALGEQPGIAEVMQSFEPIDSESVKLVWKAQVQRADVGSALKLLREAVDNCQAGAAHEWVAPMMLEHCTGVILRPDFQRGAMRLFATGADPTEVVVSFLRVLSNAVLRRKVGDPALDVSLLLTEIVELGKTIASDSGKAKILVAYCQVLSNTGPEYFSMDVVSTLIASCQRLRPAARTEVLVAWFEFGSWGDKNWVHSRKISLEQKPVPDLYPLLKDVQHPGAKLLVNAHLIACHLRFPDWREEALSHVDSLSSRCGTAYNSSAFKDAWLDLANALPAISVESVQTLVSRLLKWPIRIECESEDALRYLLHYIGIGDDAPRRTAEIHALLGMLWATSMPSLQKALETVDALGNVRRPLMMPILETGMEPLAPKQAPSFDLELWAATCQLCREAEAGSNALEQQEAQTKAIAVATGLAQRLRSLKEPGSELPKELIAFAAKVPVKESAALVFQLANTAYPGKEKNRSDILALILRCDVTEQPKLFANLMCSLFESCEQQATKKKFFKDMVDKAVGPNPHLRRAFLTAVTETSSRWPTWRWHRAKLFKHLIENGKKLDDGPKAALYKLIINHLVMHAEAHPFKTAKILLQAMKNLEHAMQYQLLDLLARNLLPIVELQDKLIAAITQFARSANFSEAEIQALLSSKT